MTERLDRIEVILDRLAVGIEETKALANSNAKTIQAMLESQETRRLEHQEQIDRLDAIMTRIASVQEGMANWLVAIDETQPTVLRRLNSIENKINNLLERD
ncbi:hypothetical protein [Merismopedia glauca]|uniref:Uncharacterized protein n=1 Tax=Merismopedia glauca CCAP 1448/3 TaxID=1296344 RepID=A0A2T1C0U2_9CYAN|nr:hypothetical protein [Merismopedia glauca]PSB01880.1 hypothetical protein C7B64_16055 [Merismopedia glauca CCAP 1448/3]